MGLVDEHKPADLAHDRPSVTGWNRVLKDGGGWLHKDSRATPGQGVSSASGCPLTAPMRRPQTPAGPAYPCIPPQPQEWQIGRMLARHCRLLGESALGDGFCESYYGLHLMSGCCGSVPSRVCAT